MRLLDCFILSKTFKLILLLKVDQFCHFYKQLDSKQLDFNVLHIINTNALISVQTRSIKAVLALLR